MAEPQNPRSIVWPAAWPADDVYKGKIWYRLEFSNQIDAAAEYLALRCMVGTDMFIPIPVTALDPSVAPTTAYTPGTEVGPDVVLYGDDVRGDTRYYTDMQFDHTPSEEPVPEDPTQNLPKVAITPKYLKYSDSFWADIYAQMRNNVGDMSLYLEMALRGREWVRGGKHTAPTYIGYFGGPDHRSWTEGGTLSVENGFSETGEWFNTVGRVRAFTNPKYNLDAIGVYATSIAMKGLAQYCINRHWSIELLIHLCISMMSGKFDIMELASYIITKDTEFKPGKTYYERIDNLYVPTPDTEFKYLKTYYELTARLDPNRSYHQSYSQYSNPGVRQLPATDIDPLLDDYRIPMPSGCTLLKQVSTAAGGALYDADYYSYDPATEMYTKCLMLDPSTLPENTSYAIQYYDENKTPHWMDADEAIEVGIFDGNEIFLKQPGASGNPVYKPIGATLTKFTVLLGVTKNNTYTELDDCVFWRKPIVTDSITELYVDKENEHLTRLRLAVNTYLTHYKRALQMTGRYTPTITAIPSSAKYNIGDIVVRLNNIIETLNRYTTTPIELLDTSRPYVIRELKLKSNEIVEFIQRDSWFIKACEALYTGETKYENFLPGDSLVVYNMIFNHPETWYSYNDLGFWWEPKAQRTDLFDKLDWSKVYEESETEEKIGRIFSVGNTFNIQGTSQSEGTVTDTCFHHYQVFDGTKRIPLKEVIDTLRIAKAWQDGDYSGSMQVLELMKHDLGAKDSYGVVWHSYLDRFDPDTEPKKAKQKIDELLLYIEHMLLVGPIASTLMVDLSRHAQMHEPCSTWAAFRQATS